MTVRELSTILYDLRVPADLYRLDGTHYEGAHVLARRDAAWAVFVSERGGESGRIVFASENEACSHLAGRLFLELALNRTLRVCPSSEGGR
jgi:hypothetical protein